jgi:hypothetical protein
MVSSTHLRVHRFVFYSSLKKRRNDNCNIETSKLEKDSYSMDIWSNGKCSVGAPFHRYGLADT